MKDDEQDYEWKNMKTEGSYGGEAGKDYWEREDFERIPKDNED